MKLVFDKIELTVNRDQHPDSTYQDITSVSCEIKGFNDYKPKNQFKYTLNIDEETYSGKGLNGNDAIWIPYSSEKGLKIVSINEKYSSDFKDSLSTLEKISSTTSQLFPKVYSYRVEREKTTDEEYLLIFMENVAPTDLKVNPKTYEYVPKQHREQIESLLPISPDLATSVIQEIMRLKLEPEDGWYKNSNFIGKKIVDFHRFKYNPDRYLFPSHGKDKTELDSVYEKMVKRYLDVKRADQKLPKWKGKIYQGFMFDNGYNMRGYVSDNKLTYLGRPLYDSYRKLSFFPTSNLKNKKVLDIGSNQGFFSFQSSLSGASSVVGLELTKQDVLAAEDIKRLIKDTTVEFKNVDAVKYIDKILPNERFGLVILNSVLHQIYPNFKGADSFLTKIAKTAEILMFETPLNHKLMNISPEEVIENFKRLGFKAARLVYIYDAYSSGYRANFICYGLPIKNKYGE